MKCISKFVIASLLLGAAAFPAVAADLPQRPVYKAAPMAAPGFNWTGFYLGVMGGYAFGANDADGFDGGFAGGTVGYNYQPLGSAFVFGIEGDAAWTDFGDSISATGGGVTVTVASEAKALATLRARLGMAFDRSLIYVTGGGAWMRNEISVTATAGGFTAGLSDTQDHFGYAVGAGWEQAFAPNWSAKVEYLYLGLGSETYFSPIAGGVASGDLNAHTIKVGLNYRFGYR